MTIDTFTFLIFYKREISKSSPDFIYNGTFFLFILNYVYHKLYFFKITFTKIYRVSQTTFFFNKSKWFLNTFEYTSASLELPSAAKHGTFESVNKRKLAQPLLKQRVISSNTTTCSVNTTKIILKINLLNLYYNDGVLLTGKKYQKPKTEKYPTRNPKYLR